MWSYVALYTVFSWIVRTNATLTGLYFIGGAAVVVGFAILLGAQVERRRFGPVRVAPEGQPALTTLVGTVAQRSGLPVPDRIWITSGAAVTAVVRRRRQLCIGLPLAVALSESQLQAAVARELSVMSHGRLVVQLYRAWAEAKVRVAQLDETATPKRRDVRMISALDAFGTEIALAADRTAATAIGVTEAIAAAAREQYLDLDFRVFSRSTFGVLLPRIKRRRFKIEDLHDGWARCARAGAGMPDVTGADLGSWEDRPYFAPMVSSIAGQLMTVRPSMDAVALGALTTKEQRRLATACMPQHVRKQRRTWCTFATAPSEVWRRDIMATADGVWTAVTQVLGHRPADAAEAADVVRTRLVDVCIAQGWAESADDINATSAPVNMWIELLEGALVEQGWLRTDPAVPGNMRSPAGRILAGRDVAVRALTDDEAYAELRDLLARTGERAAAGPVPAAG